MPGISSDNQGTSTRPYLLRALHDWCTDNGFTPYIAVQVGPGVRVPMEYVKNNEIVLNISAAATNHLSIGNDLLEFEARFGGVARQVSIPIDNVSAIFAQENGRGMAFEVPKAPAAPSDAAGAGAGARVDALAADGDAGLPAGDAAPGNADAGAPAAGRARKRPKLSAVPATSDQPAKPARRKTTIAAVPAPAAVPDSVPESAPQPPVGDAAAGDQPGDDGPGPTTPKPGRPRLTRVK